MIDSVLRDKILAAFFQGPDAAVEIITEMLAAAWDDGVEARRHNAQVAVEKSQGVLTAPGRVIGAFDYSQDDEGRGTFEPAEDDVGLQSQWGPVPTCHCQSAPPHIWQPDHGCPQDNPVA